jgi:hypothetical protein
MSLSPEEPLWAHCYNMKGKFTLSSPDGGGTAACSTWDATCRYILVLTEHCAMANVQSSRKCYGLLGLYYTVC